MVLESSIFHKHIHTGTPVTNSPCRSILKAEIRNTLHVCSHYFPRAGGYGIHVIGRLDASTYRTGDNKTKLCPRLEPSIAPRSNQKKSIHFQSIQLPRLPDRCRLSKCEDVLDQHLHPPVQRSAPRAGEYGIRMPFVHRGGWQPPHKHSCMVL